MKFDNEEREFLESVEKGEWQSIPNFESEAGQYQAYAKATFRKDKRINIRISERDLIKLQQKALAEGLPYQTLIASILHKYVSGRLVERGP
jgi:predicted DNA binding CopG/RHH family protein